MKLTSQEEYGLRCILTLARRVDAGSSALALPSPGSTDASGTNNAEPNAKALTVSEIAEIEGLSVQYAGKLTRILAKAGLLESVRGCKGGYRLARPAQKISISEIVVALGGKIYESGTCERFKGDRQFCVHSNDCSIRSLWSGLQMMIDMVLDRTTLHDLIGSEKTMIQWVGANSDALALFNVEPDINDTLNVQSMEEKR